MTRWTVAVVVAVSLLGLGALTMVDFVGRDRAPAAATPTTPPDTDTRTFLSAAESGTAARAGGFVRPPASLLRVSGAMRYGDWLWKEAGVPAGPISIRVDLRSQLLSVFRGPHEIGTAVVLYGADQKETPLGRFPILWKGRNHRSSLYDAPMPFTLRLTGDGVAIHGSDVRWGAATHGCVGVPTEFASHLFAAARLGDPVLILRSDPKPGRTGSAST